MPTPREVDVFHGNDAVATPVPRGVAAAWNWLKAQVGNTHPGACRPFGMVSACPYSGGYSSGYNVYGPSYDGPTPTIRDRKTATGITHFHHSGTGFVGSFYNYFRVVPFAGSLSALLDGRWDLWDEEARPGYYAGGLAGAGVRAELTVGTKTAWHRYTFADGSANRIGIDLTTAGLEPARCRQVPALVSAERCSANSATAHIVVDGFPLYAYAETDGRAMLWQGAREQPDRPRLQATPVDERITPCGILFDLPEGCRQATLRLGFSFRSAAQARRNAAGEAADDFDEATRLASAAWSNVLDRIHVTTDDDDVRSIFASCLYHSLLKPIRADGESPWWSGDTPFFCDFITMWDMYKTQLPLVLSICPDVGAAMVTSILDAMEAHGEFPVAYLLSRDSASVGRIQAAALGHHTLFDAWARGIRADWPRAVDLMDRTFATTAGETGQMDGLVTPYSRALDLAGAAWATATMARHVGNDAAAGRMTARAGRWRDAFDPATARLASDKPYYEGTHWNYSFRPLPWMQQRIGLYAQTKAFVADLDHFFGYRDIADGSVDPRPDPATWQRLIREDRFEGLNNESDMETPYAYAYAGRHDRVAEIVRAVMACQFTAGPGGLPGNDDSGGLSSWYVWNAIGLFPVSGQDRYLIGSPILSTAELQLGERTLTVRAQAEGDDHIHVQRVVLNGQDLNRIWLKVNEVHQGGELVMHLGPEPRAWGGPPDAEGNVVAGA